MSDTTATVLALSAQAQAQAAAREARKAVCLAKMPGFTHNTATVEERREYAECVQLIYPDPMTGSEVLWFKVAIVLAILGAVAGTWIGFKLDGFIPAIFGFLLGGIISGCTVGLVWLIWEGLKFLFS